MPSITKRKSTRGTHYIKKYDKEAKQWATNSAKMYHIVMQHRSSEMKERLQALQDWPRIKADKDVLKLIRSIKSISHQHDETKQGTMALVESDIRMITLRQEDEEKCWKRKYLGLRLSQASYVFYTWKNFP